MKRLVALALLTVLGFAAAGCGSSKKAGPTTRAGAAPPGAQQRSPREGRIAFLFGESGVDHPSQLGVRDADGRNARPLQPWGVNGASWSPDGRSIAFALIGGGISTMNVDGRPRQRRVIRKGGDPDWSPNGRAIAFDRFQQRDVWVFNLRDRRQRRIVRNGSAPDWSPDGKKLAFTRGFDKAADIWVVEVSSKKQRRVARHGLDPRWSPDGRQIAFERCTQATALDPSVDCFIYVMRSDGTKLRRLFEGESPAWSPTGREIAFYAGGVGSGITRARLDGSHRRELPSGPFPPIYCPCWGIDWSRAPDARR